MRLRLPDGSVIDTNFVDLPGATPCRAYDPTLWSPSSIGTVLIAWHTHPFTPAIKGPGNTWYGANDPLPTSGPCGGAPNRGLFPGFSGPDVNHEYPQIVIDKTNAYWLPTPPVSVDDIQNAPGRIQKKQRNQCDVSISY